MIHTKCHAVTKKGHPCGNYSLHGGEFCNVHVKQPHVTRPTESITLTGSTTSTGSNVPLKINENVQKKLNLVIKHPPVPIKYEPSYSEWITALIRGQYEPIVQCLGVFDLNREYVIFPSDGTGVYPLLYLCMRGFHETLSQLIQLPKVDLNVHDSLGRDLMTIHHCCCDPSKWMIHKKFLQYLLGPSSTFTINQNKVLQMIFNEFFPYRYEYAQILLACPRIEVNQNLVVFQGDGSYQNKWLIQLLSDWLEKGLKKPGRGEALKIMPVIQTIFSRRDLNLINLPNPIPQLMSYVKFHQYMQIVSDRRKYRKCFLPRPNLWTVWQKLAYKVFQNPPLSAKELTRLRTMGYMIGLACVGFSPIAICVGLAQHYENYRKHLTYNHHLSLKNEVDLCENPFSEMPREHIIVDDVGYGFSLIEMERMSSFKKHPYLGQEWSQITIQGVPFDQYMKNHPVNPIDLMHFMNSDTIDINISADDQATTRLMEHFAYVTPQICQIYSGNQLCRNEFLKRVGIDAPPNPSYELFVEKIIEHLLGFPPDVLAIVRRNIYSSFEICQVWGGVVSQ